MNGKQLIWILGLALLLTVSVQAAPKAFNSLGSDLESFQQKDCKAYQKITSLPEKIKKKCTAFDTKINNAFKVGYKLDPYIDSEISEKKLHKYLSLLRDLNKRKENILSLIYTEAKKARKQNNTKYYSQLIANDKLSLYSSDYRFMEKNKDMFFKNEKYLSHVRHMKYLEEQKKRNQKKKIKPTNSNVDKPTNSNVDKPNKLGMDEYFAGNWKNAYKQWTEACNKGSGASCTNIGHLYNKGEYVGIDIHKAKEFYKKGCKIGYKIGCIYYHQLDQKGF